MKTKFTDAQLTRIAQIQEQNHDEVVRLRAARVSLRQIAAKLGIGYGTVRLRLGSATDVR